MPFEIVASAEPRMLVLRAHGIGSATEGHRAFHEVQAHAAYFQGMPILVDTLELTYMPTAVEAREFAGLFATAFPCSVMAVVVRDGDAHEVANDIARLSMRRGAIVAAFTSRLEAVDWLTSPSPLTPELATVVEPTPERIQPKRVSDWVAIPYTLREKIETTPLDIEGHDCPLWLDSAAGRPLIDPEVAEVTVSTEYEGSPRLATVDVRVASLDDEEFVVSVVVNAMRAVLAGAHERSHATASAVPR